MDVKQIYLKHKGDIAKVLEELGLEEMDLPLPSVSLFTRSRIRPETPGNPSLVKFIVSVRHIMDGSWPGEDKDKIQRAKDNYGRGTHEMFQGREGPWIIQYCQPRKKPVKPGRRWFVIERGF